MMPEIVSGNLETLSKSKFKTWRGWAIYLWDMGFSVILFAKKPKAQPDIGGWDLSGGVEGISPYFLKACGVTVPFEKMDEEGRAFYYGKPEWGGEHPPIRIELRLPMALLEQLRLI